MAYQGCQSVFELLTSSSFPQIMSFEFREAHIGYVQGITSWTTLAALGQVQDKEECQGNHLVGYPA